PQEYLSERIDQYIGWYNSKAVKAKRLYQLTRASSVIGAAVVPVLVNLTFAYTHVFTTIISLALVIFVSLESVYLHGDLWKNYRSTEQFLSREKVVFQSAADHYRNLSPEDAIVLFISRCEAQISAENSATLNVLSIAAQQPDKTPKDGTAQAG